MIYGIIVLLIILACCLLIFLVSIQNSKGGGLASNLQGANVASQLMGVRRAADVVEKATWATLGAIVLLTFFANIVISSGDESRTDTDGPRIKSALENAPAAPKPAPAPAPQPAPQQQPAQEQPAQQQAAPAGNP